MPPCTAPPRRRVSCCSAERRRPLRSGQPFPHKRVREREAISFAQTRTVARDGGDQMRVLGHAPERQRRDGAHRVVGGVHDDCARTLSSLSGNGPQWPRWRGGGSRGQPGSARSRVTCGAPNVVQHVHARAARVVRLDAAETPHLCVCPCKAQVRTVSLSGNSMEEAPSQPIVEAAAGWSAAHEHNASSPKRCVAAGNTSRQKEMGVGPVASSLRWWKRYATSGAMITGR